MASAILNQLQELQIPSNKKISPVVLSMLQDTSKPRALVETVLIANGKYAVKLRKGAAALTNPANRQSKRKVKTFSVGSEKIINGLNKELMGGENYPILTTALGIAIGAASGGAGLLFTLATTGLSLGTTIQKVLARPGDEIWQIEEIGKSNGKAIYVSAFFIVDPFRKQIPGKGWLIHEEREELLLT